MSGDLSFLLIFAINYRPEMSNQIRTFEPQIFATNTHGSSVITVPNPDSGKSVVFSNSGDSGDMTGPEISVMRQSNIGVRGGNDGGQSASQHGMD